MASAIKLLYFVVIVLGFFPNTLEVFGAITRRQSSSSSTTGKYLLIDIFASDMNVVFEYTTVWNWMNCSHGVKL